MSATGRSDTAGTGYVRQVDDFFRTEPKIVRPMLPWLGDLSGKSILEPSCGDGGIIEALPAAGFVTGIEFDAGRAATARALGRGVIHTVDFFAWAKGIPDKEFDVAIGNPPYALAMEFLRETTRIAKVTVFLLRLPFLASKKRAQWLRANTPTVNVLDQRPSFCLACSCKNKKKGCTYSETLPSTAERPSKCPLCGAGINVSTSDATDYGWLEWREGAPTVRILEVGT